MKLFSANKERDFMAVGLAVILMGVGVLAVGVVQVVLTWWLDMHFGWPMFKVISGVMVIALGYIVLQLEMLRLGKKVK